MGKPIALSLSLIVSILVGVSQGADAILRGRVVDQDGKPIANAVIQSTAVLVRNDIDPRMTMVPCRTDQDGHFSIETPAEMLNWTIAEARGYSNAGTYTVTGQGPDLLLTLKKYDVKLFAIDGIVSNDSGKPAAGMPLRLYANYGATPQLVISGTDGSFHFDGLTSEYEQCVIVSESPTGALPIQNIRPNGTFQKLQLVRPSQMIGSFTEEKTGKPIPNVLVSIHPAFANDFLIKVLSDAQGRWDVVLPPGTYRIEAEQTEYFLRNGGVGRGGRLNRGTQDPNPPLDRVVARSGEVMDFAVVLAKRASLSGTVVDSAGRPVENAIVAWPALPRTIYNNNGGSWLRTDKAGKFRATTGQLGTRVTLVAFDPVGGISRLNVDGLVEGDERKDLRIVMTGSARVGGRVMDENGAGVAGISIELLRGSGILSGEDGKFDLGRVPLADVQDGPLAIRFVSPRPDGTGHFMPNGDPLWHPSPQKIDQNFYQDASTTVPLKANASERVEIRLKRADLLLFQGKVLEPTGAPAAHGAVYLFSGTAQDTDLTNAIPRMTGGGGIFYQNQARKIGAAECDAEGNFKVYAIRPDGKPTDDGSTIYSIGAATSNIPRKVVTSVIMPADQKEATVKIELGPPPPPATAPARGRRGG